MSAPIELIRPILGTKPYILVEVDDWTEDDLPVLRVRFGGGFEPGEVKEFLALAADGLVIPDAPLEPTS